MEGINDGGICSFPSSSSTFYRNVKDKWNIVVEGYKPQDFSFFHRSEKLVQHINLEFEVTFGTSTKSVSRLPD